jgi:DNA-binding MarR family transcriptional regulator
MQTDDNDFNLDFLINRIQKIKSNVPNSIGMDEKQIIGCRLLYEITQNMQQDCDNKMEKYGLVGEAWIVLMIVYSSTEEKIIANDICCHLGKNKSTTSRIIESLIQKNLLTRIPDAKDRRQIFLHITEDGKKFINDNILMHTQYNNNLWKGIDMDLFINQLIKIHQNAKEAKLNIKE